MSAAGGGHRHFLPARSGDPQTSQLAPPEPDRFVSSGGKELFTNEDVIAGKGGFQKADLMNYGILYGMGSYCGEDYGASVLVRMASLTQNGIAQVRYGAAFSTLAADQQSAVIRSMRAQLQQVDLTRREVVAPDAIATLQQELESSLTTVNRAAGWTPASSLSSQDALHTALFGALGLIYFCLRYAAGERAAFSERAGLWAFWLYNAGLVLWIVFNFFPIGWPQLDAAFKHGLAYARSTEFYGKTLFWQWMRLPGDVVFDLGGAADGVGFPEEDRSAPVGRARATAW